MVQLNQVRLFESSYQLNLPRITNKTNLEPDTVWLEMYKKN